MSTTIPTVPLPAKNAIAAARTIACERFADPATPNSLPWTE